MNYVKNMEIIAASAAIWATLVLGALITTCGMIRAHLKEPAEIQLTSGKGQTMNKYNEIEIQTAKNMLKEGYTWIARDESGGLFAYIDKPSKLDTFWCSDGNSNCVCSFVPIFQSIHFGDKEPVSLEDIVHPQILDDERR